MKNRILLSLLMIAGSNTFIHSITIDEIRESKKDELIDCYEKLNAFAQAIQKTSISLDNRSVTESFKDGLEFGKTYPNTNVIEAVKNAKTYKSSVKYKELIEIYQRQQAQCNFIKREVPSKYELESIEEIKTETFSFNQPE